MFEHFVQRSQSDTKNQNMKIYGLITMHISEFILFVSYAKLMVKLFFNTYIFLMIVLYENTHTNSSFLLQAMILGHEQRPIKLIIETHANDNLQKGVQQLMDSRARKFMISWISTFFFLSYYFLKLSD